MRHRMPRAFLGAAWAVALLSLPAHAANLDTHVVQLDASGKLVSWVSPQDQAYDRVMTLSWERLLTGLPNDPGNGLSVVYTHSEYDPVTHSGSGWPNNPAGKNAMLADAARHYYAYSGDVRVIDFVRGLIDHQLDHGTTPATGYSWARVPWSTAAAGSVNYGDDALREGVGVLEPDKLGELGYHGYLFLYEWTGDTRYRDAAIACADALVSHLRTGTSTRSPWPYRVNAQTGAVVEDYCADIIAPILLFDELIRLNLGNVAAYQTTRQAAWSWLMTYPMSNNVWVSYFEDVGVQTDLTNLNQYDAGQTARYLLEHPGTDPNWSSHVTGIVAWIEAHFGGTDQGEPGTQYGARVISEQEDYKYKMASHSSRYATVNALYYEATGDTVARNKAFRTLNWCTYMCRNDGVVIEGPAENANNDQCWFTDGHGDYIRHFMLAMGACPQWAPASESHLLRSTSVVKSVTYGTTSLSYTTFDAAATEVMRLTWTPLHVVAAGVELPQRSDLSQQGWTFDTTLGVLRVRHDNATSLGVSGGALGVGGHFPVGTLAVMPNPVPGVARIDFTMPHEGAAEVTVSDLSGRLVSTLVSGLVPAGARSAQWDGTDAAGRAVAAGVYVVRLHTPGGDRTAKLVRMR